ncbi:hypothetical protein C8R42DRAFT_77421 [Lentinula raphanica]|nr:hypothetical protein C8R42DRAFT_77421 [Lentinula raphanica]
MGPSLLCITQSQMHIPFGLVVICTVASLCIGIDKTICIESKEHKRMGKSRLIFFLQSWSPHITHSQRILSHIYYTQDHKYLTMVKILATRTVILSLSLLQAGLITSVLAAPTATVAPVHSMIKSNAMKPLASGTSGASGSSAPDHSNPRACAVANVQKKHEEVQGHNSIIDSIYEKGKFNFASLLRDSTQEDFEQMIGVIEQRIQTTSTSSQAFRDKALQRISAYKLCPNDEKAKKGVLWWFDMTVFSGMCSKNSRYQYRNYGTDMYDDYCVVYPHYTGA